jgi:hypothetical protein
VCPQDGRFLVAADDNLFDFFKGKWVVRGRHGIASEADVVSNTRWHGLRGIGAAGCFHEAGGYAGLCERLVVVLQDDMKTSGRWQADTHPNTYSKRSLLRSASIANDGDPITIGGRHAARGATTLFLDGLAAPREQRRISGVLVLHARLIHRVARPAVPVAPSGRLIYVE